MTQYICPLCSGVGSRAFSGPTQYAYAEAQRLMLETGEYHGAACVETVRPCSDCSGTGRLTVESVRDIRPQYYDIGTAIGRCGKEGYVVRDGVIILVSPGHDELPLPLAVA